MIKTHNKLRLEENHLSILKAIYEKPKENILFNGENLKAKSITIVLYHCFGVICYTVIGNQNINKLKIHAGLIIVNDVR